ncbi:HTH-type transcriptional repressor ComR [Methyloligella halotolerans]|uniref:HTH-type transcriptional repressor ComR n=1 Tax=Methyloligella halotolerans TaxID=1177755 RepID=A0A1E2RYG7_9HYPH|nr:TetR/AcrR family transcriptional regulator [Methyloligella halotolerans]ODA67264.1 HTH-type transcriptional repressor ComR [Methyloligella halotolerans]
MATDTRELLLKETETLLRTRGYAAFSYADLAEKVGIRKASIHHHFPTKEALGAALIDSYLDDFRAALDAILANEKSAIDRLNRYAAFFVSSMKDGMMPLCGALSAEAYVLPESLQVRVRGFFELHLEWLQGVIREGKKAGELRSDLKPKHTATLILSTLEGASLVAWAMKDPGAIKPAIASVVRTIEA